MPFSVSQFRAQMENDGARPNLFEIIMPFPTAVVPNGGQAMVKMNFMARSAQLPGSTMGIVPVQYFGREVKLSGNRVFPEWTTTILNDEDFVVRRALEQWMNGMNSHQGNLRNPAFRNTIDYSVDAVVNHFAKVGDIIRTYRFVGMYPQDVSPVELDWGANDTIEEYTVTWAYQYWIIPEDGIV